ncbi:hypothetical protein SAMN05216316_3143 [Nitrosovibrio sp. Nv6]|nr:hypothetical protein SAMN05216316_3143 [Nitrosovibrio sp. Nv6]
MYAYVVSYEKLKEEENMSGLFDYLFTKFPTPKTKQELAQAIYEHRREMLKEQIEKENHECKEFGEHNLHTS